MKASAYIKLDNPAQYLRILKGDTFKRSTVSLRAVGGGIRITAKSKDPKSIASAIGGVKKQVAIIKNTLELLQ